MIDRPLYVEKIIAYSDTPFVKILNGRPPMRQVYDFKNDYGKATCRERDSEGTDCQLSL